MTSANIVQKLWNYCNVLRDDGMSYLPALPAQTSGDYVETAPVHPAPAAFGHPCPAQLTYLLLLFTCAFHAGRMMSDERAFINLKALYSAALNREVPLGWTKAPLIQAFAGGLNCYGAS